MATILTTVAKEEGTYMITCAFTDEDGDAVAPDSITWTLSDSNGSIINSREDVAVGSPASSVDIVLSGDDLAIQAGETASTVTRRITIEAVYDSDAGSDLPLKDEAVFPLENLLNVT